MTIKELQQQAKELKKDQGWSKTTAEERLLFIISEVGELVKEYLKLSDKYGKVQKEAVKQKLGMEIYDVFWNLCDLANILNIDLETVFKKKYTINQKRKWKAK